MNLIRRGFLHISEVNRRKMYVSPHTAGGQSRRSFLTSTAAVGSAGALLPIRELIRGTALLAVGLITAAATLLSQATANPCPAEQPHWQEILREIHELRLAIVEARLETAAERVPLLKQTLDQIRFEQLRLKQEQALSAEQVAQLDAQLATANVTPDQRLQLEDMRSAMTGGQTERIQSDQSAALEKRYFEILNRLRSAEERRAQLDAVRKVLSTTN
jgi:hypothetical protein